MTVRPRRTVLGVALLALALTACGGGDVTTQPAAPAAGVDAAWTLVSGSGPQGALTLVDGSPVTLVVKAGKVSGRAACNSYGGPVSTSGGGFTPGALAMTEMACADEKVNALESGYLQALGAVTSAAPDADRLVLTGEGVTLTFTRDAPVVDLPLEGTAWVLDSQYDGDTVSTTVGQGALRLSGGTVSGRGGCREFRGSYQLDGSTLTMSGLRFVNDAAVDCAAGPGRQDELVLDRLGRPVTAAVEGSRLTLLAGDIGFGFTAPTAP
jgi:heat shock protein HslJ